MSDEQNDVCVKLIRCVLSLASSLNKTGKDLCIHLIFDKILEIILYTYRSINNNLERLLHKRTNMMPQKPPLFPLQSEQQVTDFNNISDEEYENTVEYLRFLGGFTLHDAVKFCFKEAITDGAIKHYSAWGEHGNLPLFNTMLIKAVYDAVCMNSHFPKPMRDEFFREKLVRQYALVSNGVEMLQRRTIKGTVDDVRDYNAKQMSIYEEAILMKQTFMTTNVEPVYILYFIYILYIIFYMYFIYYIT